MHFDQVGVSMGALRVDSDEGAELVDGEETERQPPFQLCLQSFNELFTEELGTQTTTALVVCEGSNGYVLDVRCTWLDEVSKKIKKWLRNDFFWLL